VREEEKISKKENGEEKHGEKGEKKIDNELEERDRNYCIREGD